MNESDDDECVSAVRRRGGEEEEDCAGSPEKTRDPTLDVGKNCFTCILSLNMTPCIATHCVSHAARAQQVTHGGVGHQKTG